MAGCIQLNSMKILERVLICSEERSRSLDCGANVLDTICTAAAGCEGCFYCFSRVKGCMVDISSVSLSWCYCSGGAGAIGHFTVLGALFDASRGNVLRIVWFSYH